MVCRVEFHPAYHTASISAFRRLKYTVLISRAVDQLLFLGQMAAAVKDRTSFKAGDTLSSRHVSSCDVNACSWDVRDDLALNSMAQIYTSVTLLTSRDLAWSSGQLTCQHASQISTVTHIT
jgi:hypothetical protein